eukprot:537513-Amphidinium_carterae.1
MGGWTSRTQVWQPWQSIFPRTVVVNPKQQSRLPVLSSLRETTIVVLEFLSADSADVEHVAQVGVNQPAT